MIFPVPYCDRPKTKAIKKTNLIMVVTTQVQSSWEHGSRLASDEYWAVLGYLGMATGMCIDSIGVPFNKEARINIRRFINYLVYIRK